MRVALCSMPEVLPWIRGESWHVPNLALCNIAGNTPNHDVVVYDLNRRRRGVRRAVERILDRFDPQILGLSAMTFQYDTARAIAWLAKQRNPKIVTVLGGYHASMLHREIAASWDGGIMDWIVRGEGDRAIGEIIEVIQGRREPTQVLGASFRDGEQTHHNDDRPLQDLATLELPARHKRAYIGAHLGVWPADVLETSRGCTMACNFCSMNTMYGKSHRYFPIDTVLRDIEQLSRRFAKEVFCADDNLTNDLPRLEALLDAMIAQRPKLRSQLRITTQASCAGIAQSQRLVDKLAKAGVTKVFLGIENGSSKTLKEMKKGDIVELTKTAVRRLHQAGIICVGGCIVGFPDDDVETIRRNFEFFRSLDIELTIPQIITPYPGTAAREIALRDGYVTNEDDLRWYNGYWANVRTKHLSSDELEFWRWKLAREVIGPFRATEVYQRHYPVASQAWNLAIMPAYKRFDRTLTRVLGERRRYERAMADFRRMDQFDLEPPPVPFRVETLPLRKQRFSMKGLQRPVT